MIDDLEKEVESIIRVIKEIYTSDTIPWIIGYSGGKDSTVCVQLVWEALSQLPIEQRQKAVYVISTDTLVENPVVSSWVTESLKKMERTANEVNIPIRPHRLVPKLTDRFWVNLIGKGYPSPRPRFRWCTERLKIQTATSFIHNLAETNGEAIMVIGTRRAESSARAKTMDKYAGSSREHLSRNADPKLSRVWIFTPIADWSNDDVWEYIGTHKNAWGVNSSELISLYRGATPDNECPVITDTGTQSCGDSRFGCYVCTMVSQDKSMEAMITNDDSKKWMQPILDFRNHFLTPKEGEKFLREFRRLNSDQLRVFNNQLVRGPYTQAYRAELLRNLLIAQEKCRSSGASSGYSNVDLISKEELDEIRRIWVHEKCEIEDLVPQIYKEVTGKDFEGAEIEVCPLEKTDLTILREVCEEWLQENHPSSTSEQKDERTNELYQLTRTLLASTYQSGIARTRSKQLDAIEKVLKQYAFLDEKAATEYALKYISSNRSNEKIDLHSMMPDAPSEEEISQKEIDEEHVTERQQSLLM